MSFLKPVFTAGSALWLLLANTSLEAPRLGYVRLENREVWSLRGLAGAFYYGQFAAGEVDKHTFNGSVGIRTTGQKAEVLGSSGEVLRTAQLDESKVRRVGLSTIEEAAYIQTGTELWRMDRERADRFLLADLHGFQLESFEAGVPARIVGLTGAGRYIELAIAAEGQVTIRRIWLDSQELLIRETFSANPEHFVFLPAGMSIWTEAGIITLRKVDGSSVRIETDAQFSSLQSIGKNLVQAGAEDGRQFVLHLNGNPLNPESVYMKLLQLPESAE